MSNNLIYAYFRNGSIFHLKNAKIEYIPNQVLMNFVGANSCIGITDSDKPIPPYKLDDNYIIIPGHKEYKLTFENVVLDNEEFLKESFFINDLEFKVIFADKQRCVAMGQKFSL